MAENPVEFDYCWFEVFLEDIDDHIVRTGAQRIVVELRGDAAHEPDRPPQRRRGRSGALDAAVRAGARTATVLIDHNLRCPDFEQDGAFEDHVAYGRPARAAHRIEITHNDRSAPMHSRSASALRVGEDDAPPGKPGSSTPLRKVPSPKRLGQLPHAAPHPRCISRLAAAVRCRKPAMPRSVQKGGRQSLLPLPMPPRNAYPHHSCPSGKSISGYRVR